LAKIYVTIAVTIVIFFSMFASSALSDLMG
jgi:hypothetical protein